MLAASPMLFPSMPILLAQILFGVSAVVLILGLWGLIARRSRPMPTEASGNPPRNRPIGTGISVVGVDEATVEGNKIKGADTAIDVRNTRKADIGKNEID